MNNDQKRSLRFKKTLFILFQASILFVTVILPSCSKDRVVKTPQKEQHGPDTLNRPDTTIHLPDTLINNPDTIVTDPDTISYKKLTISWAATDFKEYDYNEKNQLTRYYFQYMYVQNDPKRIKYFDYRFTYDEAGKLTRSTYNDKIKTVYEYQGNVLKYAKEYNLNNELLAEHEFTFNNPSQLVELISRTSYGNISRVLKYIYEYSAEGNLVLIKQFYFDKGEFLLTLTYHWDLFDNKAYLENATSFNPYVPGIQYWKNNFGRKIVKDKNGNRVGAMENYSYSFNSIGNPLSKTTEVIFDSSTTSTCYYKYHNW